MSTDPIWTENDLADLRREFGDAYAGRTVLVTGADGFMGSHLTDALVEIGADVHAFVRATSSGALNNISHLRNRLKVKFADLTDKTSIDYLVKELRDTVSDKPYVFHLGAQAHVGESWHRPYETVMANTIGTLNLLQSIVDYGLELEKFDTAGTSEEYGNVRENVAHHHDFDDAGGLILHERSPINPKSIYATAKVAADFLTMNYHDAFGVPGVVTRMFNNYGPRQNPRYVTGTIITQALARPEIELGALEPLRDFCFCTDGVRGHLTVAAKGIPGDVYVYGQGSNISMADWADLILRTGVEHGFWPDDRHIVIDEGRLRPGVTDVMALRVGYEKLNRETGWEPKVSWEEGVLRTIQWYAEHRERWIGRVDWLGPAAVPASRERRTRTGVLRRRRARRARRDLPPPPTTTRHSDYRRRWEDEAARGSRPLRDRGRARRRTLDYAALTGKIAPVWDADPARAPTSARCSRSAPATGGSRSTSRASGTSTWSTYCALDISETMLDAPRRVPRAVRAGRDAAVPRSASPPTSCRSQDDSVDTVLTSAVFLHMGKSFVARAVAEIARMLRPGGDFVFDASFPNARNPSNLLLQAKPKRLRSPNFMKFWTRGEVERAARVERAGREDGRAQRSRPAPHELLPKRHRPGTGAARAPREPGGRSALPESASTRRARR